MARVRRFAELAVRANRMTLEETRSMLRMYEEGLAGYTYLERSEPGRPRARALRREDPHRARRAERGAAPIVTAGRTESIHPHGVALAARR